MFKTWTRVFDIVETAAWGGSLSKSGNTAHLAHTLDDWHPGNAGGFVAQTRVATPGGWRECAALSVGDIVLSVDNDWQPVRQLHKSVLWTGQAACPKALHPIYAPAGVFGARQDMLLLPEQGVMLESEHAYELFGAFAVIVPAALLEGFCGIRRHVPDREIDVVSVVCERDELLITDSGALVQCSRRGPATLVSLEELLDQSRETQGDPRAALPVLDRTQARALLSRLHCRNGAKLGYSPQDSLDPQAAFA